MTRKQADQTSKLILGVDEEVNGLIIDQRMNEAKAVALGAKILVAARSADLDLINALRSQIIGLSAKMTSDSGAADTDEREFFALLTQTYLALTGRPL